MCTIVAKTLNEVLKTRYNLHTPRNLLAIFTEASRPSGAEPLDMFLVFFPETCLIVSLFEVFGLLSNTMAFWKNSLRRVLTESAASL